MRHYRRSRQNSGKLRKILFRIVFVIVAALVITLLSVMLGHYLKNKAESTGKIDEETDLAGTQISREPTDDDSISYHSETVFGVGVNINEFNSADEISRIVATLSQYYDTLNIVITESDGTFKYTSPALCKYLRVPTPENNKTYSVLESAIKTANTLGMRVCVIMDSPEFGTDSSILIDGTAAAELASRGVDEILFIPELYSSNYVDYNTAYDLRAHFNEVSDKLRGKCALGVLLPANAYENVSNEKQLQMIASAVSFMAIDMSSSDGMTPSEKYTYTTETISSLLGTFGVYNMRVIVMDTDTSLLAATYTASVRSNINNISFTHTVTPEQLSYTPESITPTPSANSTSTENESQADNSNPYAVVQKNDTEGETDAGGNNSR